MQRALKQVPPEKKFMNSLLGHLQYVKFKGITCCCPWLQDLSVVMALPKHSNLYYNVHVFSARDKEEKKYCQLPVNIFNIPVSLYHSFFSLFRLHYFPNKNLLILYSRFSSNWYLKVFCTDLAECEFLNQKKTKYNQRGVLFSSLNVVNSYKFWLSRIKVAIVIYFLSSRIEFCFLISWYNTMLLMTGVDDFINLLKAKVAVSGNFGV